jgi:hypothetical protein
MYTYSTTSSHGSSPSLAIRNGIVNSRAQEAWPRHCDSEPDISRNIVDDNKRPQSWSHAFDSRQQRNLSVPKSSGSVADLSFRSLNQLNVSDAPDALSQSPAEQTSDPHSGSSTPSLCPDTTIDSPGPATLHSMSSHASNDDGRFAAESCVTGNKLSCLGSLHNGKC